MPMQPTPVQFPGAVPRAVLSTRQIVWGLFFDPAILFFLQRERWWRGFRVMAAFALVTGLALGGVRFPTVWTAATEWSSWLGREVGTIHLTHGELAWDRPKSLPYTTRHRGWRLDFVPAQTVFVPPLKKGPETRGVWISPNRVNAWYLMAGDSPMVLPVLANHKIWGVLDADSLWPAGLRLSGEDLPRMVRDGLIVALPFFLIQQAVGVLLQVFFYTALFAFIPVFLRGAGSGGGFGSSFAFYCFASVPPLIVAGVYSGLGLPFLEYDTVFVLGFVVYLFLAARGVRREQAEPDE